MEPLKAKKTNKPDIDIDEGFVSNGSSSSSSAINKNVPDLVVSTAPESSEEEIIPEIEMNAPTLASDPVKFRSNEALIQQTQEIAKLILLDSVDELGDEEGVSIELVKN